MLAESFDLVEDGQFDEFDAGIFIGLTAIPLLIGLVTLGLAFVRRQWLWRGLAIAGIVAGIVATIWPGVLALAVALALSWRPSAWAYFAPPGPSAGR